MVGSGSLLASGHRVGEVTPFCRYSTASPVNGVWSVASRAALGHRWRVSSLHITHITYRKLRPEGKVRSRL